MRNASRCTVHRVKLGWTQVYLLKCTDGYLLVENPVVNIAMVATQ